MGCWNGTCGLSSLPIMAGEEMYVFPIVESRSRSFCYSSAFYRPSVVPFLAAYNDYGAGEECSGAALPFIIESIKDRLVELEVGENKYHDIAVKRDAFDVDLFFEACHESRLLFKNPLRGYPDEPKTLNVFFTMVRKDVVDRLWSDWTFEMYKPQELKEIPEGFDSDQYSITNVTYEKLDKLIPEYLAQCKAREDAKRATHKAKEGQAEELDHLDLILDMQSFFGQNYKDRDNILSGIFCHIFGEMYEDGGFVKLISDKTIRNNYVNGNEELAVELMRNALIGHMINSFMTSTRKVWLPPTHQGSQSQEFSEYKLLNNIVGDVVEYHQHKYDDYED